MFCIVAPTSYPMCPICPIFPRFSQRMGADLLIP